MTHNCNICGKTFSKADGLTRHRNRKVPCVPPVIEHVAATPFRVTTQRFNKELSKDVRAAEGIYFTPHKARELLFTRLEELGVGAPSRILEPSFGTGEFIMDARARWPSATIVGVEKNEKLSKSMDPMEGVTMYNADFLTWMGTGEPFDLILGNPPYFVMKTDGLTAKEKREFAANNAVCMTGRPNIYVRFIYDCLATHLAADGYLAFILPTSIYNSAYYQPMRDYIAQVATVCCLESLNQPGFFDTAQETLLMILQKRPDPTGAYMVNVGGVRYLSPHYTALRELLAGTTTLHALGLGVKTGNVVWNQVKDKLVDAEAPDTKLLIYSSNIAGGALLVSETGRVGTGGEKKQYVKGLEKPTISGPVILVDRGYGNSYTFNAVCVARTDFYAENHINVIYPRVATAAAALERVMTSFQDPRTARFVEMFVGNGGLSATELETVLPIF
jgi:hypothetical protein